MGQSGTSTKKVTASSDANINGILEGSAWDHVVNGQTVLTWSEPTSSTPYSSYSSTTLTGVSAVTANEDTNIRGALGEWSAVSNLVFNPITETSTTHADLRFAQATATPDSGSSFFGASGSWPDHLTLNNLAGDTFFHSGGSGVEAQLQNTQPGSWGDHVARHEIGHDLGLKHAFDTNAQLGATGATGVAIPAGHDSWEYTVMTYHAYSGAPDYLVANRDSGSYAQSLMMDDIKAIQYLYGANFNTNSGDTRYTFDSNTGQMFVDGVGQGATIGNKIFRTIWDGGGNDTYDLSNYTTNMTIDLRPEHWSTFSTTQLADLGQSGGGDLHHAAIGNVANAQLYQGDTRSLIENAIGGSGNDTIIGNDLANTLRGGGGNDTLNGGAGADIMRGGSGNDTYIVDNVNDVVDDTLHLRRRVFDAGGIDEVRTTLSTYSLATNNHIENLTFIGSGAFTGTGNAKDNVIIGGFGDDKLFGADGNDRLSGGNGNDRLDGGTGADTMMGGRGNDTYVVDNVGDIVSEFGPDARVIPMPFGPDIKIPGDMGGIDTIETTLSSFALNAVKFSSTLAWIENLTFTGTGNFAGTGNALSNTIIGGDGDDQLLGMEGNDFLYGGKGNDVLVGGTGDDRMVGGAGDDVYLVDSVNDKVVEQTARRFPTDSGGTDEIRTTLASYSLADNASISGKVEDLSFIGTGNFLGHGNALDNVITGNNGADSIGGGDGNDVLRGMNGNDMLFGDAGNDKLVGGEGADVMNGGSGNDTYYVDNVGDVVQEGSFSGASIASMAWGDSGGIDEVRTTLSSYTLADSNAVGFLNFKGNIENLTFNGTGNFEGHGNALDNVITGGAGADKLFGNAGADTLFGGAGNDSLFGGSGKDVLNGGAGADHLTGGKGADKFVFDLGDNGVTARTADHITDFAKGETLDVSDFVASHHTIEASRNFGGDIDKALDFANAQLAAGHNVAGSAVLTDTASHNVFVFLDQDGDHKFESAIVLDHADALKSDLHTEIMNHQLFV